MADSLAACWCRCALTRLTLARYRGARLQRLLDAGGGRDDDRARADAIALAARLQRAASRVPRSRCLDRAITLTRLLRDRGIAARLRLGVRRRDDLPRAHAWVEIGGHPIGESAHALAGFEPLRTLETAVPFE